MKLHLPKQLFTALLAVLTLAAPAAWGASQSTTVYVDETTGKAYTTDTIEGLTLTPVTATVYSGSSNNNIDLSTYDSNSTVVMAMTDSGDQNYFNNASWETSATLIIGQQSEKDGTVSGGMYINNGNQYKKYTFKGSISGAGDIVKRGAPSNGLTLTFAGDMSRYTGNISIEDNAGNELKFVGSSSSNMTTGTGTITSVGNITFTNTQINNSSISVTSSNKSITFSESNTIKSSSLSISGTITNNGTLTVNSGATLTAEGTFTSTNGTVSLAENATLSLGAATHSIGTLGAASGTVSLAENATLSLGAATHSIGTLNAAEATVIMNAGASLSYTSGSIGSLTSNGSADNTNEITLAGNEATLNRVTTGHVTLNGSGVYYAGTVNDSNNDSANPGLGTVTLGESWNGYVAYTGGGNSAALAKLEPSKGKLLFKGVTGHISENIDTELKLENPDANNYAVKIMNGSSKANDSSMSMATFTGAITGGGTMYVDWNTSNYTGFTMEGDLSGWTGKFEQANNSKFTLFLNQNANTVGAELINSGSGQLNVNVNTTNAATFKNTVNISNLTLSKSAIFNGSLTVSGTTTLNENATTLTLSGGTAEAPVAHSIGTLNAAAGTVSLEANANLTLGGGTAEAPVAHSIGTLNAAAGSTLTLNNASSLTLGTASTIAGNVTGTGNIASNYNTTFSGDVSGWTGSFTNGAAMTLTFNGSASAVNAAITQTTGNLTLTVNQSTTFNGAVKATTMKVESSDMTVTFAGGVEHQIGDINPARNTGLTYDVAGGASLKVLTNIWMTSSSITLAKDASFSHEGLALKVIGTGNSSSISRGTGNSSGMAVNNTGNTEYTISNADVNMSNSSTATLGMLLTQSSLTTKGIGKLTVSNSGNTITNLAAESGNVELSASMRVDSISAKKNKTVTVISGNTIAMGGGAVNIGTNGADAIMTAKTDSAMARLQADASFTIQDMTLTNTTITAATPTTQVKLQNVAATNLALAQGKFTMNVAPTVGEGGTTAEFGSDVVSLLAVGSASLTLNMDVIGAYESTGAVDNVTLTITLDGITGDVSKYGVDDWKALVGFEENSWLGHALTGAQYSVPGVATAAESGVPSVNYGYEATGGEGSNVGTLTIIITGLNVPEPTTATLSLLALAALAARRRRND